LNLQLCKYYYTLQCCGEQTLNQLKTRINPKTHQVGPFYNQKPISQDSRPHWLSVTFKVIQVR